MPAGPVCSKTRFGAALRLGATVSCTVTVNVACALLPAASVATQVTVVTPAGKVPGGGVQTTFTAPSTRSLAVGGV